MASLTSNQRILGVVIRKRIGHAGDPDPMGINGIYRYQKLGKKRFVQRMDFYNYVITHTPAQQANRSKFADAISAWQALSLAQKEVYNEKARGRHMSGYNLFIRYYML